MRNLRKTFALGVLAAMLSGGVAFAQEHRDDQERHDDQQRHEDQDRHDNQRDNHTYVRHDEWRKGYHMQHEDWDRGEKVDYRANHLRRPPSGYEWRLIDGSFVLGSGNGVVASVVVAPHGH